MKLLLLTAMAVLSSLVTIFFFTPEEATQGIVQKIFYIHVSSAITMYLGFFIAFLAGIMYLLEKKTMWDEIGSSAAEVGWIFCTAVLLTGPIWARPIWGTWWTWEPRLTTTFLLWLLYSAYLFIRNAFEGTAKRNLVSAILTIIAFIDVPLIHYSVKLWRGIHPTVINAKPGQGGLPDSMKATLTLTMLSFFVLFGLLFRQRYRLEKLKNRLNEVKEG